MIPPIGVAEAVLVPVTMVLVGLLRVALAPFFDSPRGQRLLPLLPIAVAVVCSLLGVGSEGSLRERIALGLLAGALAAQGYKVGRTTLAGMGLPRPGRVELELPPPPRVRRR